MAHSLHLYQIKDTYYFRCRIPADLKVWFAGKDDIKRTLKTKSLTHARRQLTLWSYKAEHVFTMIRSGILTPSQMQRLVHEFKNNDLRIYQEMGSLSVPDVHAVATSSAKGSEDAARKAVKVNLLSVVVEKYISEYNAPKNLVSKKRYRGINIFMLACQEYSSPYWMTFKQVQDKGGHVIKGSKSTPVIFWKWLDKKDAGVDGNDADTMNGKIRGKRHMVGKIEREQETILKMVRIYCDRFHGPDGDMCSGCRDLAGYAVNSVSRCPYGANKPVCGRCPANCFSKDRYLSLSAIMRYAGPRMLYKHPLLAVRHLLDAVRLWG